MYGTDPTRNRPMVGREAPPAAGARAAFGTLVVLLILLLALAIWPRGDAPQTSVTEDVPTYRAPAAPSTMPSNPK